MMNGILKRILWYCYFTYDYIRSSPTFKNTKTVDTELSKKLCELLDSVKETDAFTIFACFKKQPSDSYVQFVLSNIKSGPIIIVNNVVSEKYGVRKLSDRVFWINRPNILRDLGAYRVALDSLSKIKFSKFSNVVLFNDSFFILKKSFFDFFNMTFYGEYDLMCHSFSTAPYPHARSYCIRIRSSLVNDLNSYLQKIPPVRSRYAAINFGEIGMSKNVFLSKKIAVWLFLQPSIIGGSQYESLRSAIDYLKTLDLLHIAGDPTGGGVSKHISNIDALVVKKRNLINDLSLDPYEIRALTDTNTPDLIKRELFEKRLVTKQQVLRWVEDSDLTHKAKADVTNAILINKKPNSLINRIKVRIGEI